MDDRKEFREKRKENIALMASNKSFHDKSLALAEEMGNVLYTYNFDWLGVPAIQLPQDMIALQEIIWETKPDLIIETGVARGGSVIYYASLLKLMDINGKVVGVDIDIRPHNRDTIETHFLSSYITLIQGSSIDSKTVEKVADITKNHKKVMVILDSNHTHEHVLRELELYSPLVSSGCYMVVMDTLVEDMPDSAFENRPWGKGNNPKTAVHTFLKDNTSFVIDAETHTKLGITVAPDGYLKCIK